MVATKPMRRLRYSMRSSCCQPPAPDRRLRGRLPAGEASRRHCSPWHGLSAREYPSAEDTQCAQPKCRLPRRFAVPDWHGCADNSSPLGQWPGLTSASAVAFRLAEFERMTYVRLRARRASQQVRSSSWVSRPAVRRAARNEAVGLSTAFSPFGGGVTRCVHRVFKQFAKKLSNLVFGHR